MAKQTGAPADATERLWVLWSGFHDGAEYAYRHPTATPYLDADRTVTAAAAACERRHASTPLDRTIVHPAYTYGWMAGYLAAQREMSSASSRTITEIPLEMRGARLHTCGAIPSLVAMAQADNPTR